MATINFRQDDSNDPLDMKWTCSKTSAKAPLLSRNVDIVNSISGIPKLLYDFTST